MLITIKEAIELLERSPRGIKVSGSTIRRWGKQGLFPMVYSNGIKIEKDSFIAWATKSCRLKGCSRQLTTPLHTIHTRIALAGKVSTAETMLALKSLQELLRIKPKQ